MTDELSNRVVLVTGGSKGIGAAICQAFAAQGAHVMLHYNRSQAEANTVAEQIRADGGQVSIVQGDVTEPDAAKHIVEATVSQYGKLDVLVNNAGGMGDGAVVYTEDAAWEHMINLNLSAAFRCARAAIPHMQAQSWGRIINVTSQAAYRGSKNHAGYAAAKAGMSGFTYSLALEVAKHNITVNLVAPGRIATELVLSRSAGRMDDWMRQTPLRRLGTTQEVAAPVVFLATEGAAYITGATFHVNGGLYMS